MYKSAYLWQSALCCFTGVDPDFGGMDLSFIKGDESAACATLVVCELPSCEVVYEDITMVQLTAPYVPGRCHFSF